MSEFPMRLRDDEGMPEGLRADLRAALPQASEYDVAAGFARFEALIADGAGGPEDDPGGERDGGDGGDGEGSDGGSAEGEGAGLDGGDAGGARLDGGGDVSGAGSLAGGEAGGAGSLAGGHAGGAVGLAGGAAEMGPIAIPGLSTGGGLLAAKIVAGLAVLGAVGAGVVFQNRAPEKPTVVTSAQVRESGPEVRGPGEGVTGESATGRRAQGAQEAASGQAPGQRAGAGSVAENGAEHGALGADQGQGQGAVTVGTPEPGAAGVRGGSEGASLAAPGGTLRGAPASSGASPAAGETPAEEGSTEEGSTLKDEVEHLATLRELSRTDPARAAAMALEGHSRFRKGVFWQEREVLMIHALASSGRSAEARSRGEAFLARHPESPFAETLRRTLGITP